MVGVPVLPRRSLRLSSRSIGLVVSALVVIALAVVAFVTPVPYVTMKPGPTFNTLGKLDDTPMFTFGDGVATYPTTGTLEFTSVSVTRAETRIYLLEVLEAWFEEDSIVVPHDFMYPDNTSNADSDAAGAAQLANSQDASTAAALRAAGFDVSERVIIDSVVKGSPADGALKKGDEIVAVDGRTVATVQAAADSIADRKPGDDVTVTVVRKGLKKDVVISTVVNKDAPNRPRVGVTIAMTYDFPIEIENHIGDRVGGPSAGMMFALSMYDQLTKGPLTGGQQIAGTGSIQGTGEVGAVGGIAQKMAGAESAGADIFLVPAVNCGEYLEARSFDMTVVKVTKLQDAIDSIEALAKNPKAKVPSC